MEDLVERARAPALALTGLAPEAVAEAMQLDLGGRSVHAAARDGDVSTKRRRRWSGELNLERSEAMAMRRAAGQAGAALHFERPREAAALGEPR